MRLVSALLDYYGHFVLSRRYGISLRFPSILLVIALILTVLIPGISLAEHFRAMCITVFFIVLLESGSKIPTINACIKRALAFVFEYLKLCPFGYKPLSVSSSPSLCFMCMLLHSLERLLNGFIYPRISLPLVYFQLSNFIGNVISSSIFLLGFLANRSSFSSSPLVNSNIGLESSEPQAPIWSELPTDMIHEIGNRTPNFLDTKAILSPSSPSSLCFMCMLLHSLERLQVNSSIYLRISLPLVYFQLSNFIGNVISSSIFLLGFLANRSSFSSSPLVNSNIGLESNEPHAPILSELPTDMIHEIGNRTPNFIDIKAILTFCNPCSSACLETTSWSLFPWLMLSNKLDSDLQCFVNLCNNKCYWLELPTSHEKRCWGSQYGWVVTLGPDYEAHLVHVRKGLQIALPPVNSIRALAPLEEWFRLVHKFIILKDPSHEFLFLVIAIFGPVNRLAFARVALNGGGDGMALNRRGQGQWVIVTNPENLKFNDVACFNDKIYTLCDNGKLVCLELDAPLAAEVQVIAPQPSEEEIGMPQKLYLMKSQKTLITVFRYGFDIPSKMRHETIYFLVYQFNFIALAWEVTDLEDCTAFVGDGNSWCIPTSTIPSRSNCIYFIDDNWELQMYAGVAYGGRDLGVFNIAQRDIQHLPSSKDNPRFYSRPIWVTPSYYTF